MRGLTRRIPDLRRRLADLTWAVALIVALEVLGIQVAAANMVLVSNTTLVTGSQSAVYAFQAPGPGTVTAQLTNIDWPTSLQSLSLVATTANQVLAQMSASGVQTDTFDVRSGVSYFAHVNAVAGGTLDLGVYSLSLTFTPAASPVPLPASGWLMLGAVLLALLFLCRRDTLPDAPVGRAAPGTQA